MKTVKFASKRLRVTRKGKVLFRHSRQNHFNAKQSGNQARAKRGYQNLPESQAKIFKQILSR